MPKLKRGIKYKIKFTDEENYFYAVYLYEDRGFLCFDYSGQIIACRSENIEISN